MYSLPPQQSQTNQQTRLHLAHMDEVLARAPAQRDWLSSSEQARAARLRAPQRLAHYLSGHWLLREVLARVVAVGDSVEIIDRQSLPPQLAGRPDLHLSLSHSGPWIACAVSTAPIGIDLEQHRPREALSGFDHLLRNPDEPPGSLDPYALLERWVVKEAYIKRDCGSALPERLAELQVYQQSEPAEVCLWQSGLCLLASTDPTARPVAEGAAAEGWDGSKGHWRVVDLAKRRCQ